MNYRAYIIVVALMVCGVSISRVEASVTQGSIVTGGDEGYAWSNNIGWVNFGATSGSIAISDDGITGHAWSSKEGWIHMDPDTSGVLVSGSGALSGSAWGEGIGWVDFTGVRIDGNGRFTGQAHGAVVGTLTFDCDHCSVTTDYRPASVRPPAISNGGPQAPAVQQASASVVDEVVSAQTVIDGIADVARGIGGIGARLGGLFGSTGAVAEDVGADVRPAQLFDIRLLVDEPNIARIYDLVARITFDSFGTEATPVDLTYTVSDMTGRVVWTGSETVTVQTQRVVVKRFADVTDMPELPDGRYTLRVHTRYNGTVEDDFSAAFFIGADTRGGGLLWLIAGIPLLLGLAAVRMFLVRRIRQHHPTLESQIS